MSITLITGIPGSGKTLFAVNELKKFIEENNKSDDPCNIYCDITGLKISDIPPPPLDWRETPPKSLLIYDEAQFHEEFKARRGLSPYKQIEELTIHRKTAHKIWFITQDPSRLHRDILAMVEIHYHLERPYGAKLATIYQYRGAETKPSGISVKQRAENKRLFNYDKRLYELYESSQVDDGIKFRLPKELTIWCILAVIVGVYFYTQVTSDGTKKYLDMAKGEQVEKEPPPQEQSTSEKTTEQAKKLFPTPEPSESPPPQEPQLTPEQVAEKRRSELYQNWLPSDYAIIKSDENLQVRAVIKIGKKCRAYNTHGDLMTLTYSECSNYLVETGRVHRSKQVAMPVVQQQEQNAEQVEHKENEQQAQKTSDTTSDDIDVQPTNSI